MIVPPKILCCACTLFGMHRPVRKALKLFDLTEQEARQDAQDRLPNFESHASDGR